MDDNPPPPYRGIIIGSGGCATVLTAVGATFTAAVDVEEGVVDVVVVVGPAFFLFAWISRCLLFTAETADVDGGIDGGMMIVKERRRN
jgi:hypothetical protein